MFMTMMLTVELEILKGIILSTNRTLGSLKRISLLALSLSTWHWVTTIEKLMS